MTVQKAGFRDAALHERIARALEANPFAPVKRLRRDVYDASSSCWLHGETCCLSMA